MPWGLLGIHHFYLGNIKDGIFFLCTLGGFGIYWIVDIFLLPVYIVEHQIKWLASYLVTDMRNIQMLRDARQNRNNGRHVENSPPRDLPASWVSQQSGKLSFHACNCIIVSCHIILLDM